MDRDRVCGDCTYYHRYYKGGTCAMHGGKEEPSRTACDRWILKVLKRDDK